MPDLDPMALSRSSTSPTPSQSSKSQNLQTQNVCRNVKQGVGPPPPRINLEPLYMALKGAVGEHWGDYKEAISKFLSGNLNQAELSAYIDPIIVTPTGEKERLHNKLISGIYGNAIRELPDQDVAIWVSRNDKPLTTTPKPVTGDAAEQRLKLDVMQLPNKARQRIKNLTQNDNEPLDIFSNIFGENRRPKAAPKVSEPLSAGPSGGFQMTNLDVEIRKKYIQQLACESGEFPDVSSIESRMLPICYETGILSGHVSDAPHFMSVATETFIKEVLSSIFSKTRSNGPGMNGSVGTGGGANWIQTRKYRAQLEKEEEASLRGEILRDKSGLLPVEARAASERGPLGMADVRTALELGDCGLGQMPTVVQKIMFGYREGEVELWNDFSWPENHVRIVGEDARAVDEDVVMSDIRVMNGYSEDWGWEGCGPEEGAKLDNVLNSCLAL